ncbi:MAG TPA: hypothetical protein VNU92_09595 [Edaphobacter sp.]|jgi:hypothetical protein|nr:hypothetical protein [Edaphobacter sp.]
MLRLKTSSKAGVTGTRKAGFRAVAGIFAAGLLLGGAVQGWAQGSVAAQQKPATVPIAGSKIALAAPVTYDNKYELFGGFNFQNFQAGQDLRKRMNLGGGEVLFTYWLPGKGWIKNLGVGADYRFDAGTTPVNPNAGTTSQSPTTNGTGINNRPLVWLNTGMLGAQYRGPKNQYVALNYHGYFGVSHGTFDKSFRNVNSNVDPFSATGLYTNRTKPMAALGGSIDFNVSKKWAVRISPDLILEHFGTETREFVGVSGGVIYRIGKR